MTRLFSRVLTAGLLLTLPAWGVLAQNEPSTTAPAPTTQPAAAPGELPAGHPPVGQRQLPPGHPPMGGSSLPAGHPPMGGSSMPMGHPQVGSGSLPAGHPTIPGQATTQPADDVPAVMGTLTVKAVPGTQDAVAPADAEVVVYMLQDRQPVQHYKGKTNAQGVAVFENIPLTRPLIPHAIIVHQGVGYQTRGEPMSPDQTAGVAEVKVFETTTTKPAWRIASRQVMIAPDDHGVTVNDLLVIENPSDRTWVADPNAFADGQFTLVLPLPAGAQDVQPNSGFFARQSQMIGDQLATSTPVMAGKSQFALTYRLQPVGDAVTLSLVWPAPCETTLVYLPPVGATVTAEGLTDEGVKAMGSAKVRTFTAGPTAANQKAQLVLTGMEFTPELADSAGAHDHDHDHADVQSDRSKLIVGIGLFAAVLVGVALMFIRKPARKEA